MDGVILFADNKIFEAGHENNLFKLFRQNQEYSVLPIDSLSCLEATIQSASTFKACIIDWNFMDTGDFNKDFNDDFGGVEIPSRTPLTILQKYTLYSLVYIYSGIDIPEDDKELLVKKYGTKIRFRTKTNNIDEEYRSILEDIRLFESNNPHMEIPFLWSQTINQATQTIFSELESADAYWIKEIRDTALNDGGDATSEVIDVFNNLLSEDLIQNESLRQAFEMYSSEGTVTKNENTAKLYRRLYYSKITEDSPLMTGDIFKFDDDTYGIIITPECELSNPIKEKDKKYYDFLIISQSVSKQYQEKQKKDYLNEKKQKNAKEIFNNGVISRHILISFPFEENVYNQIGLIEFNTAFRTKSKMDDKQNSILSCRTNYKLNAPYIHQLRQRFVSYFGKYGVPSIPDSLRVYNLKHVE